MALHPVVTIKPIGTLETVAAAGDYRTCAASGAGSCHLIGALCHLPGRADSSTAVDE